MYYSNTHSITREFKDIKIRQRANDGYLDATAMCKATGKMFADYRRLKTTQGVQDLSWACPR
ncbi:hypothetical protein PN36_23905 [Candidatus Thiomargarita nelsonii]|uniref:KilA/APSES-type HTH DNA-binding domain-containing protein n=1 Tax=Candidatus Thiomargarita nelsonii TaxID=1003181 RepID=A0A0A6PRA1_9GAMM|nr:hypothetical protein PN36_23905 [Candidatus Thiomargarita nelsonii]